METALVAAIARDLNSVAVVPQIFDELSVTALLKEGTDSLVFRRAIGTLVNELLTKLIPTDKKAGFAQAVTKHLAAECPQAFDAETLRDFEAISEDGEAARADVLMALISEIRANRLLEHRTYESSAMMREQSSAMLEGGQGMVGDVAIARKRINAAAKETVIRSEMKPAEAGAVLADCVKVRCPQGLLAPLASRDKLSNSDMAALTAANEVLAAEYQLRRRALIQRFQVTLETFQTADDASVDKATLRGLVAVANAGLSENITIVLNDVFQLPAIELAAAFGKSSRQTLAFSHRNHRIADVPDRGGRVNTFDFDVKVDSAKRKADADFRAKYQSAEQQRDAQRSRGGGGRGGANNNSSGGGGGGGKRDEFQDPNANRRGGGGGGRGGYSKKDYDGIRGRGGKWGRSA